jgi:predicted dehydrogenase
MATPLRIGVIGAGGNTREKHLPGLLAQPDVRLVAVANRSRESGERVAREFGIARVAADWREIVAATDLDAVCIGTWPYLHAEITIAALRAGKHVLTEARMARDHAEARAMLAEARRHPHLVTQIVPAPFSLPFDTTVRAWLDEGKLGRVLDVQAAGTHGKLADGTAPFGWRQDFALSGKNTLFLGIYYEMVRRWLRRDPESVIAEAAIHHRERCDASGVRREVRIPDSVTVLGRYADGARLLLHVSGVETSAPRNEIRVHGTAGALRADFAANRLFFAPAGGAEQEVTIAPAKRGEWRVEADFVASIREGVPVRLTDFASGERYMAFTDAVWESWTNRGVRVTLAPEPATD